MNTSVGEAAEFQQWETKPEAAAWVRRVVDRMCREFSALDKLRSGMLRETGTRLFDWVEHVALPASDEIQHQLEALAFESAEEDSRRVWRHPGALLPAIVLHEEQAERIVIRVDDAEFFADAFHGRRCGVDEARTSVAFDKQLVCREGPRELWAIERHGRSGWDASTDPPSHRRALEALANFARRKRWFEDDAEGFAATEDLIRESVADLGTTWARDLFFQAERGYWQSRNCAAQVQKRRQDALGLGWGNHDHHTYRSSREHFTRLIAVFELLGFVCRERFYAGRDAGWGAQVLEHPACDIVIFADVDLAPEEVTGDFAHEALPARQSLGTVGLWCKLHGESLLSAGMHHLEGQFDFDAAREQLAAAGIRTMEPFSDFPYLKQCFTEGERWPLRQERLAAALSEGWISEEQAATFRGRGAIGSHLEILERNDGFKGFNQTGVSDIIRRTDPRRQ